jgi:large subunit ribosomal protein L1
MKVDERLLKRSLDAAIDFSVRRKEGFKPKERNFDETVDLIINLKDINLNDPKQRMDKELILPNKVIKGEEPNILVIASGELLIEARETGVETLSEDALDDLDNKEKKDKKNLVKNHRYFVVEDKLMPKVARYLARFLGPRGKMPKPFPAGYGIISNVEDLENAIERYKKIVRIQVKKNPIVQVRIGKKSMEMEKILENMETVVDYVADQMPYKYNNIKSIFIKTTMGKPVKVDEDYLEEIGV